MAYEQRGQPQQVLFHSDQGSLYASTCSGNGYGVTGSN